MDLYNILKRGIHGIQLSEETAVGRDPLECIQMIFDIKKLLPVVLV
jgi:pyruvate kinase